MADPRHPTPLDADQRTSDLFERALFDSARADAVPERSRQRVALALGVGVPAGGAGIGGASAPELASSGHATGALAAGGGAGKALGAGSAPLWVVLAGGLAALVFLGGSEGEPARSESTSSASHVAAPSVELEPAPTASSQLAAADSPLPSVALEEPTPPPVPRAEAEPEQRVSNARAVKPRRAGSAQPGRAAATRADSRLLEEVAALDRARAAIAASDASLALVQLRRYSAQFPQGVLSREARRLEERARSLVGGSSESGRDIEEAR